MCIKVNSMLLGQGNKVSYLDDIVMSEFKSLLYVKYIIYVLLIVILILLILKVFRVKSLFGSKGIKSELSYIDNLKNRDYIIIQYNRILRLITKIVQNSPFKLSNNSKEYYQYNLNRAGVKVLGGYRNITSEEFHAIVQVISALIVSICLMIALFINLTLGVLLSIIFMIASWTLPILILRQIVASKDREILENFSDFYLMIHYVLVTGGSTPLDKVMKSYEKTTSSEEMRRFIDNCTAHIDTHGEYNAIRLIARDYREIAEVGKLMRLIRQMHDGSNIKQELEGFRKSLIDARKYAIERKMKKLVDRARRSFIILTIILIQAILSATAVYLPDLTIMQNLFTK